MHIAFGTDLSLRYETCIGLNFRHVANTVKKRNLAGSVRPGCEASKTRLDLSQSTQDKAAAASWSFSCVSISYVSHIASIYSYFTLLVFLGDVSTILTWSCVVDSFLAVKIIKDESDSPHGRLLLYSRIKSNTNNSENSQNNNFKQWRHPSLTDVLLLVVVMLITSTNSLKSE